MEIKAKEKEDIINKTLIEWTRNQDGSQGFTSNPVRGECPVGCPYCYVKSFRARYGWHKDIRFYPEELEVIRKRKKPAGIFVGSTIELFHDKTIQYMPEIMETIRDCPQHCFYLLTKQPQNLIKFSPFPDNCWVGVTATSHPMFVNASMLLGDIKASVKYLSIEPLLSWGDYPADKTAIEQWAKGLKLYGINWLIIGALTGTMKDLLLLHHKTSLPMVRYGNKWVLSPPLGAVEEIVRAADKAGVKVFLKDNLKPLIDKYYPDENQLVPNHNRIVRMEHPYFCPECEGKHCNHCGVIWGLKQELPE